MAFLQLKYHLPLLVFLLASLIYFKSQSPTPSNLKAATPIPKIAVTGSNGSVGKRVVLRALEHGYHVVGIDNSPLATADDRDLGSNFSFVHADLTNYNATLKALEGCEAIIHLAAIPQPRDFQVNTHNINVVTSWNVLRGAAELGIKRVAQASTVNVVTLYFSHNPQFDYFPLDEEHPTEPDEPYGLSKVICELQAKTIVRRYPDMRVASIRLHWSVPSRSFAQGRTPDAAKNDLFGYIQEDSGAEAFLLAISQPTDKWPSRAEAFFVVAPETAYDVPTSELRREYWPNVPLKEGKNMEGNTGFFDCGKAKDLLGWVHNSSVTSS